MPYTFRGSGRAAAASLFSNAVELAQRTFEAFGKSTAAAIIKLVDVPLDSLPLPVLNNRGDGPHAHMK